MPPSRTAVFEQDHVVDQNLGTSLFTGNKHNKDFSNTKFKTTDHRLTEQKVSKNKPNIVQI